MRSMLPPMRGLRVVDLGCGFGWFCRWARENGAASVLGVDVSERMLARARTDTAAGGVTYRRADLETLELPAGAFDLAYSSLALHYVENLASLLEVIRQALIPPAQLVFSIEHPVYMAPSSPAWATLSDGRRVWPLDSYSREGPRSTDWLVQGVVKHHRTIATTLNLLIDAGFAIRRVEEWRPDTNQLATMPEARDELDRPMFLLISAELTPA